IETVQMETKKTDESKNADDKTEKKTNEELVFELQQILSEEITNNLNQLTLLQLLEMDKDARKEAKTLLLETVETTLDQGVRIENIQTVIEEAKTNIRLAKPDNNVQEVLFKLIEFSIVENSFFDMEKTMEARNEAASNIEPVMIRAGDIIVNEGQIITNEIYEELQLAGLLKQQQNVKPTIGLALFILILMSGIVSELLRLYNQNRWS